MNLLLFLAFVLGCVLGSFVGVLSDRLPRGEQVLGGRSKCEGCRRTLEALDLIPVFSYLLLRGKCRKCHAKIPLHVLIIEFLGGVIASGLLYYFFEVGFDVIQYVLLVVIFFSFLGIFFADWLSGIIPDEFVIAGVIFTIPYLLLQGNNLAVTSLLAGIGAGLFFLILFIATQGSGMGFGDVKLSFMLGLFLGFPNIIFGLYVAFLTAAAISVILIVLKKKKLHGDTIAFGPFLILGAVFAFFFGNQIVGYVL